MTRTLSMVSRKNYNLNANEGFVIFLTSKLITCFIGSFTLIMKPQSIALLLNGNEHIYSNLDLEGEVHSIWELWISSLQEHAHGNFCIFDQYSWLGSTYSQINFHYPKCFEYVYKVKAIKSYRTLFSKTLYTLVERRWAPRFVNINETLVGQVEMRF